MWPLPSASANVSLLQTHSAKLNWSFKPDIKLFTLQYIFSKRSQIKPNCFPYQGTKTALLNDTISIVLFKGDFLRCVKMNKSSNVLKLLPLVDNKNCFPFEKKNSFVVDN